MHRCILRICASATLRGSSDRPSPAIGACRSVPPSDSPSPPGCSPTSRRSRVSSRSCTRSASGTSMRRSRSTRGSGRVVFGDGTTVTPKGSGDTICGRVRLGVHLANAALMHRGLELDRRGLPADGAVLVARMLRCFLRAHFRRARELVHAGQRASPFVRRTRVRTPRRGKRPAPPARRPADRTGTRPDQRAPVQSMNRARSSGVGTMHESARPNRR